VIAVDLADAAISEPRVRCEAALGNERAEGICFIGDWSKVALDYATVLVIGELDDVCRVVTSLDQEAVVFVADEGLVVVIPGRGDYFGDEVAEELSRILGTGAIGWLVEDGERLVATVYDGGEELLEYVSNPLPAFGREDAPAVSAGARGGGRSSDLDDGPTGTVLDPIGVDPGLFVPFGTDRMDLDALHAALVGGAHGPGAPWSDPGKQHALIVAVLGFDPAPFTFTVDQAIAADLPGARYLAASDCDPSAD
jgi:hypothetical protein